MLELGKFLLQGVGLVPRHGLHLGVLLGGDHLLQIREFLFRRAVGLDGLDHRGEIVELLDHPRVALGAGVVVLGHELAELVVARDHPVEILL